MKIKIWRARRSKCDNSNAGIERAVLASAVAVNIAKGVLAAQLADKRKQTEGMRAVLARRLFTLAWRTVSPKGFPA